MTEQAPMNDSPDPNDPLAGAWSTQDVGNEVAELLPVSAAFINDLDKAHRKDQRRLIRLNVQEIIPCLALAGLFVWNGPTSVRPVATFAAAVPVLALAVFMVVTSTRHHREDQAWGASVRDQLSRRLAQLEHRSGMYRTLAWWYSTPIAVSIALLWVGAAEDPGVVDGFVLLGWTLATYGFVYAVNRRPNRKYKSEIEQLAPLLDEFDETV